MSKRTVTVLVGLVAVAFALAFYAEERQSSSPVHLALASHVTANPATKKEAANLAVAANVRAPAQKGYSQLQYDLLWQRYKPNSGEASGPLSGPQLDNLAAITRNNTRDEKMWPAFRDVIYGNAAALENRLDTGLSADATIYLDYPYNAPVSLLDMAIKAGQRDIVQKLVRHGASVGPLTEVAPDGTPVNVETPLPLAAADGEDDVVRLLLRSGANIEQRRSLQDNNQTALDAAVVMQNVSTAYLLLTDGANVDSALGPGGTVPPILTPPRDAPPRMTALRDLLMEYGANMPAGRFNFERPHEALEMKYPSELYSPSLRPYRGLIEPEYPFHDRTVTVTHCGRICIGKRKISLSHVFAGQQVGIREIEEKIWLVSFMHYDLGFFDHETGRVECAENPFQAKVLPMPSE